MWISIDFGCLLGLILPPLFSQCCSGDVYVSVTDILVNILRVSFCFNYLQPTDVFLSRVSRSKIALFLRKCKACLSSPHDSYCTQCLTKHDTLFGFIFSANRATNLWSKCLCMSMFTSYNTNTIVRKCFQMKKCCQRVTCPYFKSHRSQSSRNHKSKGLSKIYCKWTWKRQPPNWLRSNEERLVKLASDRNESLYQIMSV